jgi:hypothetical protein
MKAINESKRRDDRGRFAQDDTTEEDEEVPALPKSQQEKRYRWDNRRQKYGYR